MDNLAEENRSGSIRGGEAGMTTPNWPISPDWSEESLYLFHERLGILCGTKTPTDEEYEIARRDAYENHDREQ